MVATFTNYGHNSRNRQTDIELAIIDLCADIMALTHQPVAKIPTDAIVEDPETMRLVGSLLSKVGSNVEDFAKVLTNAVGIGPIGCEGEVSDCIDNSGVASIYKAADEKAWGAQERDNSDRAHHSTLNHAQQGI